MVRKDIQKYQINVSSISNELMVQFGSRKQKIKETALR